MNDADSDLKKPRGSMKTLHQLAAAAVTGSMASMFYNLVFPFGGAFLVVIPLLLVSVALAHVAQVIWANDTIKYVAFVSPLLFPISLSISTLWASEGARMDGVPDIIHSFLTASLVTLLTGCVCLVALDLKADRPARNER